MPDFPVPDGPTLAFDDFGDPGATPVMFLHGLSGSRESWDGIVPHFTDRYRVLTVDQRGHGSSAHAPGTYHVADYTSDAAAFIEGVVGGPVALVGHSLGGVVSDHLAATRPELVRRAFLEDPPLFMGDKETFGSTIFATIFPLLQQMLRDMRDKGASLDDYVATIGQVPALNAEGTMADALGPEGTRQLAQTWKSFDPEAFTPAIDGSMWGDYDPGRPVSCPVHLLRADPEMGPAFFAEHEAPFLESHTNAQVELVTGASHLIHEDQPDRFVKALTTFLADA